MRLESDPMIFHKMTVSTQEFLKAWMDSLGIDPNRIFWMEYIPEAEYLVVDVYKIHPDAGGFYVGPGGNPAMETWLLEPKTRPPKIVLYEWKKAMLARQGHQGT